MSIKLPTDFDWKSITPSDSPRTPIDIMADPRFQRLGTPELTRGDQAFGFRRPLYDFSSGQQVATGDTFDLLERATEKPIALIFGSYT